MIATTIISSIRVKPCCSFLMGAPRRGILVDSILTAPAPGPIDRNKINDLLSISDAAERLRAADSVSLHLRIPRIIRGIHVRHAPGTDRVNLHDRHYDSIGRVETRHRALHTFGNLFSSAESNCT
jgi:hypothetical protein